MISRLSMVAITMLLLVSCASYKPSSAPVSPTPTTASAAVEDSAVTVVGQLYRNPSGKEAVFDADLDEDGIFAIQVDVHNRTPQKVAVNRSDMTLRLANGREISTISGASAALRVDEEGSVFGAALAFGIVGAMVAASAEDDAKQARVEDYSRKEFSDTILAPNSRAGGFVFFAPADGTPSFSNADLLVRLSDPTSGNAEIAAVPLKGFTGAASGSTASVSVSPPPTALAAVPAAGGASGVMAVSATAAPGDAYLHVPSGIAVSRAAGVFQRTRLSEPNVAGHSMLIADYESGTSAGPALASLRITRPDVQNTGKPARQVCDDQMQAAADAVVSGRAGTLIAERDVALLRNGLPVPGRMMGFRYDLAGAATEEYFYLFCDVGGGWALSHRVSFPQGQLAPAALDAFVQQSAIAPGQANGQGMPAAVPRAPTGGQTYSGTPMQGTPMTGTPLIESSPAAETPERTPGSSNIYCRPSLGASGVCGHDDPNS